MFTQSYSPLPYPCTTEAAPADRGKLARASGDYGVVIAHDVDKGITRIRLPSGAKKTVLSTCRAMVGLVAGGGRTDKPLLKVCVHFHVHFHGCVAKFKIYE